MKKFDIIVVGGGHAGIEASHIAAKMGMRTLLITLNKSKIGNMPCNPSIGGSAKGIVVREIDALGGLMGKAADKHYIQMKMLNTGKGPGVQCLRSQQDKEEYPRIIQEMLGNTDNLTIIEAHVNSLSLDNENNIKGVVIDNGVLIQSKAVILTTGTYMQSDILIGHEKTIAGPDGEKPSLGLSPFLKDKMGIELLRLKTGTPQRVLADSIDFSKAKIELGTNKKLAFSYETDTYIDFEDQIPCYLIYTTPETHKIIYDNLDKSAMYSGLVEGIGPRYCPSIEDKLVRFKDKERHQLFLEPESRDSDSIYVQGFSTSMPRDIQIKMVRSLPGMEKAIILKYAYAIEYDAVEPSQLDLTLMIRKYPGLYIAGQICGTSGYEEAAGLGIVAGINATLRIKNKEPFIMKRNESYIGVMIDDIVNKGTKEPYRLLSSRAEFRLLLRHDNADTRLRKYANKYSTINKEIYFKFVKKEEKIGKTKLFLEKTHIGHSQELVNYFATLGYDGYKIGASFAEILKRPNVKLQNLIDIFDNLKQLHLSETEIESVEILIKYEGYIAKQQLEVEKLSKLDHISIPNNIDYINMDGLALEARQKLEAIRPISIGQASRITGVNPADISVLSIQIARMKGE